MQEIYERQHINLNDAALRYKKYKEIISERIKNKQIPHNKKYHQSFFIPKKPLKCMNIMELPEPQPIICRSSWEYTFCKFCDENKAIIRWGSEILKILYKDPLRNKMAFYFPDIYFEYIDDKKQLRKVLAEIKPLKEASLSEASNGYDKLSIIRNSMKWKAAIEFSKKRGIEFKVVHEGNFGFR